SWALEPLNNRSVLTLSVPPLESYSIFAKPLGSPLTAMPPLETVIVPPKNWSRLARETTGALMVTAVPVPAAVRLPPLSMRRVEAVSMRMVRADWVSVTETTSPPVMVTVSPAPGTPAPPQVAEVFQLPPPVPLLVNGDAVRDDAMHSIAPRAMDLTRIMTSPRTGTDMDPGPRCREGAKQTSRMEVIITRGAG